MEYFFEILPTSFFDPLSITQVNTAEINIVVTLHQIIINAVNAYVNDDLEKVVINFVKSANINNKALGVNFHWPILDDNFDLEKM